MKKFTERDQEVYDFIVDFINTKGYSPSVREIASAVYMSPMTAQRHLYKLVELGYIRITPHIPRSIVIIITA